MLVWVDIVEKPSAYLWRPNAEMSTIGEVVGSAVSWPVDKIITRYT